MLFVNIVYLHFFRESCNDKENTEKKEKKKVKIEKIEVSHSLTLTAEI